MRHTGLALACWLLSAAAAAAQVPPQQQPPAAAPPAPAADRLNALLAQWEQAMKGVEAISATVVRRETSKSTGEVVDYDGTARLLRPNLAWLDMVKRSNQQVYERYICTGPFLYEYRAADKLVRVHPIPQAAPGQPADDNFISFLFGPKAAAVKDRYKIELVKEDANYYYIRFEPKHAADLAEFVEARMVLYNTTFLPRQLWFKHPNEDTVLWDFPRVDPNVRLNRAEFVAPPTPPGWTVQQVPAANAPQPAPPQRPGLQPPQQPRIVRPNGQ